METGGLLSVQEAWCEQLQIGAWQVEIGMCEFEVGVESFTNSLTGEMMVMISVCVCVCVCVCSSSLLAL